MPRNYFDIRDHRGIHRDSNGVECDDARKQAQMLLTDIIREQVPDGDLHEVVGQVRDHNGLIINEARMRLQGSMYPSTEVDVPHLDVPE